MFCNLVKPYILLKREANVKRFFLGRNLRYQNLEGLSLLEISRDPELNIHAVRQVIKWVVPPIAGIT